MGMKISPGRTEGVTKARTVTAPRREATLTTSLVVMPRARASAGLTSTWSWRGGGGGGTAGLPGGAWGGPRGGGAETGGLPVAARGVPGGGVAAPGEQRRRVVAAGRLGEGGGLVDEQRGFAV